MIFYTLSGPKCKLEIHDDKIKLTKRVWWLMFSHRDRVQEFKLNELAHFQISVPKFVWGKLEWATADGRKANFRFSTNAVMMDKIEKYMNKLIMKNVQRNHEANEVVAVVETNNVIEFKPRTKKDKKAKRNRHSEAA